ncbi:TPA_asm: hypothetical protein G0B48_16615 [Salmonella enterica subsp. indica]|uniref:Uncharacterized protein n=2 Tax=Salmonella enterica TaxID=28901 RepID=A0A5Y2QMV8_SALER|nr:hypothetical protein [Salmonella enterica subsp. arizonae]ECG1334091.1 hypothetical protein [Salmonella enterica subsp. indica]ECI9861950.1 hypothetical protein [Salmonella enterica subsp. arizonae]HAC6566764.1 hypothetical protein [Salmonella enterica subsp. indica]
MSLTAGSLRLFKFVPDEFVTASPPSCNSNYLGYTGINRDDLKFEVFPMLWNDRESLRPLTRRRPIPMR